MVRRELERSTFLDRQPDELLRSERSFLRVKRKQLDVAAVIERRDHSRRLLEHAVRQRPRAICNLHVNDLRRHSFE
jgi:hypothetical protein